MEPSLPNPWDYQQIHGKKSLRLGRPALPFVVFLVAKAHPSANADQSTTLAKTTKLTPMHTRVKTTWGPLGRRSAATVCSSALLLTPLLGIFPLALTPPLAVAERVHVQAEAPQKYTKPVTDTTGTLTKAQTKEISSAISEFQKLIAGR
nr:hypothetical protein [Corynebacterium pseudotuberculosis]